MKATKKEHGKRILSGVLIVAILAVLVFLITWSPAPERAAQQTVEVIKRDVKSTIELSGIVVTRDNGTGDQKMIQAFVDEQHVNDLEKGDDVEGIVEATQNQLNGFIDSISDEPRITGGKTEYEVIILLKSIPETLKNGMHADMTFVRASSFDVLSIPNDALYKDGDQYKVDRVLETRRIYLKRLGVDKATQDVESVNVEIGLEGDEYTVITSGLNEGDVVVAE